jgi:signal transduction histidine kinase
VGAPMSGFSQASILIVDDDHGSLLGLQEVLSTLGARIVTAASGEEALRRVLDDDFAAILMDVRMPGIDGFTTASMIRERKRSRYTPIIFLTAASEDLSSMFKGYRAGAVDFIAKPVIPEVLRSKLSVFVGLHDMNSMLNAELAERALSEQKLRTSEENLRALASHLQSVREEERIHIAREIHDELGQALTGLKFDLAAFAKNFESDSAATRAERQHGLATAIDRIINSVRRISSGLRPEVLDEIGLAAAFDWQAREFQRRTGIRCHVSIAAQFTDPDKERSTALFRIFQELLTNVARHANATRVNVSLSEGEAGLALTVEDNGRGIRVDEIEGRRSLGVLGLRERVLAFGGTIDIRGDEGKGTKVSVSIPTTAHQPAYHA